MSVDEALKDVEDEDTWSSLLSAAHHLGDSEYMHISLFRSRGDFAKTDCSQKRILRLRMGG